MGELKTSGTGELKTSGTGELKTSGTGELKTSGTGKLKIQRKVSFPLSPIFLFNYFHLSFM
jgi:hypothetical protein